MLAAIRHRSAPATASPTAGRDGLRCARQRSARRSGPRAARGARDGSAGWPACSAASWPHAAPISCRGCGGSSSDAGCPEARRERLDDRHRLGSQGVWATGFIGMRLTWACSSRSRSAPRRRPRGVVDAADHRHLVGHPPAVRSPRAAATTSATGQRWSSGTSTSRRSSAAWSDTASVNCGPSAVSRLDARHDAGWCTVMWRAPSPNRAWIAERGDAAIDHGIGVEQRLAHAHEHDVGQALVPPAPRVAGVAGLVDDLGHVEVAPEAQLAGRAERAADRAARLRRDAQ